MTTEQTIKQLIVKYAGTLYQPVLEDLTETLDKYETDLGYLDMVYGYGSSGVSVNRLSDTNDSVEFAKKYNEEILSLMKQHDIDLKIYEYDNLDSLLNDLALFGYELAAYELMRIIK